jgi:hypothetical protein
MSNIAGKAYAMNVIMPMEAWLTIVQRYIVTLCASLFNQFEFVQQQWTKYGGSFGAGNDTDPLIGLRRPRRKFVIPADAAGPHLPFICA